MAVLRQLGSSCLTVAALVSPCLSAATIPPPDSASIPTRIWESTAGVYYNDSFLIGNGRMGAAIPGSAQADEIHVNEDSFWSGGQLERVNPDALGYMPELQSYISNGFIPQAATLASYTYAGTPVSTRHFDFLGDIELSMNHSSSVKNYERWLDLADSTSGVYYTVGNVAYMREFIASNPADIIAIRIVANTTAAVNFSVHLRRGESLNRWEDYSEKVGNDTIVIGGGSGGTAAIAFASGVRVVSTTGTVNTIGDYVICRGADEAWVYFTTWTSFRSSNPKNSVLSDLSAIGSQTYQSIRAAHVADYQGYAGRVSLNLGSSTSSQTSQTTKARMTALATQFDPELAALYFQFGRYLFISCSRNGTLPPNLQGMWSIDVDPQWGSKYTININLGE